MGSRKKKVPTPSEIGTNIENEYARWNCIYENGCSDPLWEDGMNINLVRNHILYAKKVCEESLGDKYFLYPDSYFYPLPDKLPYDFMAVPRNCGAPRELKPATKTLPYSEVVKFKWSEVLCPEPC